MNVYQKIFLILMVLFSTGVIFFTIFHKTEINPKVLSSISDQDIINILKKNKDVLEYTQKHSDFRITDKEILTKEGILSGRTGEKFQALYYNLSPENNRYIEVRLMDTPGSNGFVTVIDFKNNSVAKAYGILMLKVGAK